MFRRYRALVYMGSAGIAGRSRTRAKRHTIVIRWLSANIDLFWATFGQHLNNLGRIRRPAPRYDSEHAPAVLVRSNFQVLSRAALGEKQFWDHFFSFV